MSTQKRAKKTRDPSDDDALAVCAARNCDETVCRATKTREPRPFCKDHWLRLCKYKTLRQAWDDGDHATVLDWFEEWDSQIDQAYKFELVLDTPEKHQWFGRQLKQQRVVFNFVYDLMVQWREQCQEKGDWTTIPKPALKGMYRRFNEEFVAGRPDTAWLRDCVATSRNYAIRACFDAFNRFESEVRKGNAKDGKGFPKRKRYRDTMSFAVQPASADKAYAWMEKHIDTQRIDVPKIGWIDTKEPMREPGDRPGERGPLRIQGAVRRLTFSTRAGRYWVSMTVRRSRKERPPKVLLGSVVGLDMGVNAILTLSRPVPAHVPLPAGVAFDETRQRVLPPRPLQAALKQKQALGRKLSGQASPYYYKTLHRLLDGPLPMAKWKGRAHVGPFVAAMRLALRRHHVQLDTPGEDPQSQASLTARGREVLEVMLQKNPPRVGDDGTLYFQPSKGWLETKRQLGRLDMRIQAIRDDHINKVTSWLAGTYETIVVEGFDVRELVTRESKLERAKAAEDGPKADALSAALARPKNKPLRKRRREILDLGWGRFRQRLTYKMSEGWWGGTLVQLPADEPTDRTCSRCGHIGEKLPPSTNRFACVACGFTSTRQLNTALYCESFGRRGPDEGDPDRAPSTRGGRVSLTTTTRVSGLGPRNNRGAPGARRRASSASKLPSGKERQSTQLPRETPARVPGRGALTYPHARRGVRPLRPCVHATEANHARGTARTAFLIGSRNGRGKEGALSEAPDCPLLSLVVSQRTWEGGGVVRKV